MNKIAATLVTFLIANSLCAQQADENKAPAIKLQVFVNGKPYQMNDGDTLKADNNKIVVRVSPFATFDYGALKFEYPRYFSFEYEKDDAYQNWTLNGNNFVVMYFLLDEEVELSDFVEILLEKFGKESSKVSGSSKKIGNVEMKGKRIDVELLGQKLSCDIYKIPNKEKKTHFIAFQDSKDDDGNDSKEGIDAMKLISETMKLR